MRIVNCDCTCRTLSAVFALAVGVVLVVASPRLTAQQEVKAGPEHEQFKEWEGTWDATVKSVGGESKGVATWKLGLNGLWLIEHFKADFGGMAFEGHGATSFDAAKKKYVNVWIDSMSTRAMLSEGGYDPKTKVQTPDEAVNALPEPEAFAPFC